MRFPFWQLCLFAFYIACIHGNNDTDPCNQHDTLDADSRRHTLANTNNKCDNRLVYGWYKLMVGNVAAEIPTTCVQNNVCGTQLPLRIDLGGQTLPTNGSSLQAHVCTSYNVLGQWDCCVLRQDITIQDCGNFYVYKLRPSDRCPVAYCVEDPDQPDYHNISVKPGEYVQSVTTNSPSTELTTRIHSLDSTTALFANITDLSSEQPLSNETNSSSSMDTTTASMTTSSEVNVTDGDGVTYTLEHSVSSSSPTINVTELSPDISSEQPLSNETNSSSSLKPTTVSITTHSVVAMTDNVTVTNVTDGSSSSASQPSSRSDDVTDTLTTISEQASTYSNVTESPLGQDITTFTSSNTTNTTATSPCLNWESSLCRDGLTVCFTQPSTNLMFVRCNNGDCGAVCDNFPDCNEGTDESPELCQSITCPEGQPKCKNDNECYTRCDGTTQCKNPEPDEDENNCPGQHVSNDTMTTEIASSNMSTVNESTFTPTISNRINVSTSLSPFTSTQNVISSSTNDTPDETVTSTVSVTTADSDSSSTHQPYGTATTVTTVPITTNTYTDMDTLSQDVDNTTQLSESNTTADEVHIPLTTSKSVVDTSTTDSNVSTTYQSQSFTDQTISSSITIHSVSSASHTFQSETTTRMENGDSFSENPIIDPVTTTQTRPDSTTTEYAATSSFPALVTPSTDSNDSSTQTVAGSSAPTSQGDTDVSATSGGESDAVVSTQSTNTVLLTSTESSGSSNEATHSSLPSTATANTQEHSTVLVPSSSDAALPTSSIKATGTGTSSSVSVSTDAAPSVSSVSHMSVTETTTTESIGPTAEVDNTTTAAVVPTVNIYPVDGDKQGLIHYNFGLFVFIVVASTLLLAICIFGIVGYTYQQRRLRTWTPRMAYQDAYADLEKKTLSCPSYLTGIESPIADIDIMHEEKVKEEETSLSQASTLALSPTNGRENGFEHELQDSPSHKSLNNDGAYVVADGGETNQGFGDENTDGIVPVEDMDDEPPSYLFPWIDSAEDTKL